jgi:hypothetical protein
LRGLPSVAHGSPAAVALWPKRRSTGIAAPIDRLGQLGGKPVAGAAFHGVARAVRRSSRGAAVQGPRALPACGVGVAACG